MTPYRQHLALVLFLVLGWTSFQAGLSGVFLLDDFPNLKTLERIEEPLTLKNLSSAVFSNPSGDGGRSIAMLSFAVQYASWPEKPAAFKTANLLLHLLNGYLVFQLLNKLLKLMQIQPPRREWLALSAAAIWLLHPIQVSTVLYVVQRMTELSATFVLLGLLAYLAGRQFAITRPWRNYLLMTSAFAMFGGLAVLSKENGVLLILYAFVLEFTILRNCPSPPYWKFWQGAILFLPALAIGGYFAVHFSTWILPGYELRDFTLGERLLTEARALTDYLGLLFLPRPGLFGLFHDDYPVSRSLFDPSGTVWAVALLIFLFLSALYYNKRYPVYAFAVLWFFAGHLMESTVIPLELYFEHRNYLPSVGIFFALLYGADHLAQNHLSKGGDTYLRWFVIPWIFILSLMTWNESRLWGNPIAQAMTWAEKHPNSIRASLQLASVKLSLGDIQGAEKIYAAVSQNTPSIYPTWVALGCLSTNVQLPPGTIVVSALLSSKFSKLPFAGLEQLVIRKENGICQNVPITTVLGIFDALLENPNFVSRRHLVLILKGRLLLADQQWDSAMACFKEAYRLQPNVETALLGVKTTVLSGHPEDATPFMQMARQANSRNLVSKPFYRQDIDDWDTLLMSLQEQRSPVH